MGAIDTIVSKVTDSIESSINQTNRSVENMFDLVVDELEDVKEISKEILESTSEAVEKSTKKVLYVTEEENEEPDEETKKHDSVEESQSETEDDPEEIIPFKEVEDLLEKESIEIDKSLEGVDKKVDKILSRNKKKDEEDEKDKKTPKWLSTLKKWIWGVLGFLLLPTGLLSPILKFVTDLAEVGLSDLLKGFSETSLGSSIIKSIEDKYPKLAEFLKGNTKETFDYIREGISFIKKSLEEWGPRIENVFKWVGGLYDKIVRSEWRKTRRALNSPNKDKSIELSSSNTPFTDDELESLRGNYTTEEVNQIVKNEITSRLKSDSFTEDEVWLDPKSNVLFTQPSYEFANLVAPHTGEESKTVNPIRISTTGTGVFSPSTINTVGRQSEVNAYQSTLIPLSDMDEKTREVNSEVINSTSIIITNENYNNSDNSSTI